MERAASSRFFRLDATPAPTPNVFVGVFTDTKMMSAAATVAEMAAASLTKDRLPARAPCATSAGRPGSKMGSSSPPAFHAATRDASRSHTVTVMSGHLDAIIACGRRRAAGAEREWEGGSATPRAPGADPPSSGRPHSRRPGTQSSARCRARRGAPTPLQRFVLPPRARSSLYSLPLSARRIERRRPRCRTKCSDRSNGEVGRRRVLDGGQCVRAQCSDKERSSTSTMHEAGANLERRQLKGAAHECENTRHALTTFVARNRNERGR